jgi:hypothetical protein
MKDMLSHRRYRTASILALCIVSISPTAGRAAQALSVEIVSSGGTPVQIDNCRAAFIDKPGPGGLVPSILLTKHDFYIAAAVDFTNIAPQPLVAVRFTFDLEDTFNQTVQSLGLDWFGTFSPNVQINARRNLAGTVGAVGGENASQGPVTLVCSVQYARYSDGRVWHKGDRSATPGLYFPPTPSPTATPL